jgi:hypothetical protein
MEELRPGLWTWTAPHPEWHDQPVVRSYAARRRGALVLIDPITPPAELVSGQELQIALTCPWHARSVPGAPIPDGWLPQGQTRADYDAWLAGFRGLPVELVLPTHGDPGGPELLPG